VQVFLNHKNRVLLVVAKISSTVNIESLKGPIMRIKTNNYFVPKDCQKIGEQKAHKDIDF